MRKIIVGLCVIVCGVGYASFLGAQASGSVNVTIRIVADRIPLKPVTSTPPALLSVRAIVGKNASLEKKIRMIDSIEDNGLIVVHVDEYNNISVYTAGDGGGYTTVQTQSDGSILVCTF